MSEHEHEHDHERLERGGDVDEVKLDQVTLAIAPLPGSAHPPGPNVTFRPHT